MTKQNMHVICGRGVRIAVLLGCVSMLMGGTSLALAQAAPIAVDYTLGHLSWTEAPTPANPDPPTGYNVRCGTVTGGPYTIQKQYPISAALTTTGGQVPLSDFITMAGTYFCVVNSFNSIGGSPFSTEVGFQASHVSAPTAVPATPGAVTIKTN